MPEGQNLPRSPVAMETERPVPSSIPRTPHVNDLTFSQFLLSGHDQRDPYNDNTVVQTEIILWRFTSSQGDLSKDVRGQYGNDN